MFNDYNDLAIFLQVILEGSFANAAKKLGVPPSKISRRVARLEESLGAKLINRNPRTFQATSAGDKLFKQCSPLIDSLEVHLDDISSVNDEIGGSLAITTPILLAQELLGEWFVEFQSLYPKIQLSIHTDNRCRDLLTEEVELAIRVGPLEDSSLIAQRLWDAEIVMYASQGYLDSSPTIHSPSDIYAHSALFFRSQKETWVLQHKKSGTISKIKPSPRFFINDIRTVIQATQAGIGIACLPKFAIEKPSPWLPENNQLTPILTNYSILPKRTVYLVYQDGRFLSKNARILKNFIHDRFERI